MMPELICAAGDPRWLDERRKGITATDITAIIGISPYESAYSLYHKKTGVIPDVHEDSDRLRLGRELEPVIVQRWLETGALADWDMLGNGSGKLMRNDARRWQMSTPDRLIVTIMPPADPAVAAVLEVKSWDDFDRDAWADGPPPRVRAQVLWQMDTLDVARGHVGVLFLPSGEFRSYVIEHAADCYYPVVRPDSSLNPSCKVCEDIMLMRTAGYEFMMRLADNGPPSADGSSATLAALRARFPAHKGKEAEIDSALWNSYEFYKDESDRCKEKVATAEALIREQLGEATILTVGGTKVGTRVTGTSEVKAHTRTSDYIRRTPKRGEN